MKKQIMVRVYNTKDWHIACETVCNEWWEADAIERQYNDASYYVEVSEIKF